MVTPLVLLMLTFGLGITAALVSPAWQAVQPELVPRRLIPAAAALGSMNVNIARAVGPAVAGLLLVVISPAALFAINALSTVAVVVALVLWRRPPEPDRTAEPLLSAMRSGSRYLRHAPGVRRVLLRTGLFVLPASALWALLAVVANQRLDVGPGGYGVMLGALGAGAVLGALGLRPLRERLSRGALLGLFSSVYAAALVGAGVVSIPWVLVGLLLAAGMGWLVVLSTFSTTLQLTLPAWVRARGMAGSLTVLMGGQGLGAVAWGLVALRVGVEQALVAAGVLLGFGALTQLWWPLRQRTGSTDPSVNALWPEPELAAAPDGRDGPVMVEGRYVVTDDVDGFVEAARRVGVSRRRTGATAWALYRDLADPSVFIEVFVLPTWDEHLRQHHERLTGYDRELDVRMSAHAVDAAVVRHRLLVAD
jgi:predicted MFS family arabinose efflux permease